MPDTNTPDATVSRKVESSLPTILLKGEIDIYPDQRLAHLDQGPIKAFAAKTKAGEKAFAMICERHFLPQVNNASKYYGLSSPNLPKLVATGVVNWYPTKQQRYCLVFENKLGRPILPTKDTMFLGLRNDVVLNTVVRNLVPVLREMRDNDFVHGHIRPSNLYDGFSSNMERILLGECLSAPAGSLNPSIFEPIERAVATPLGRGIPSYADDMFSFGATLAVLLRHEDPLSNMSEEQMLQYRMEHGSYAALTGKERFTGSLLELLRGLLNDDPRMRWTIDDVLTWLDGRRVGGKQGSAAKVKATRPIDFNGYKVMKPEHLALLMAEYPSSVSSLIESNDLRMWLNRSVQNKLIEGKVEEAIDKARTFGVSGANTSDRFASFISIALGPNMPIMYKRLKLMPEAFGRLLVEAWILKKDIQPFVDIINTQLPLFWMNNADATGVDVGELTSKFETCRAYLKQNVIGYGIERCIYFICPDAPCLSEKMNDFFVRTPEELLNAFEALATSGNRPVGFIDRHIAAFLSVRERAVIDPYIPDLNAEEQHRKVIGTLRVLATIQSRFKMSSMPGITAWLFEFIKPLIERFHDRETRIKYTEHLYNLKDKGDITKMSALFDNPDLFASDLRNFKVAMKNFTALREESKALDHDLKNDPTFGHDFGRQMAALCSGILAAIIILGYISYRMTVGGF
jgi:eukaryotic-like serine/threonine-protein kinase